MLCELGGMFAQITPHAAKQAMAASTGLTRGSIRRGRGLLRQIWTKRPLRPQRMREAARVQSLMAIPMRRDAEALKRLTHYPFERPCLVAHCTVDVCSDSD